MTKIFCRRSSYGNSEKNTSKSTWFRKLKFFRDAKCKAFLSRKLNFHWRGKGKNSTQGPAITKVLERRDDCLRKSNNGDLFHSNDDEDDILSQVPQADSFSTYVCDPDEKFVYEEKREGGLITEAMLREMDSANSQMHIAAFFSLVSIHKEFVLNTLKVHPEQAMVPNSNGELPLHYICMQSSGVDDEVFHALLAAYPEASKCENNDRSLPLHLHCMVGAPSFSVVKSLLYLNVSASSMQSEFNLPFNHPRPEDDFSQVFIDDSVTVKDATCLESTGSQTYCGVPSNFIKVLSNSKNLIALLYARQKIQCNSDINTLPPSLRLIKFDDQCQPIPPQTAGTEQGFTALHFAALNGAGVNVLKLLLQYAPESFYIKTSQGRTPFDCCTAALVNNVKGTEEAYEFFINFASKNKNEKVLRLSEI